MISAIRDAEDIRASLHALAHNLDVLIAWTRGVATRTANATERARAAGLTASHARTAIDRVDASLAAVCVRMGELEARIARLEQTMGAFFDRRRPARRGPNDSSDCDDIFGPIIDGLIDKLDGDFMR